MSGKREIPGGIRRLLDPPDPTPATTANMREHYAPGVFAYSPFTGEECSADPRDYFWLPEGEPLRDSDGEPMELGARRTTFVPVGP